MSEHMKDSISPLGQVNVSGESSVEPQQVGVEEYSEVDLGALEGIANETEQQEVPRLVIPEGRPDGDNSQPASAFSSSSEEGVESDDESGEKEGNQRETENEENATELRNKSPMPSSDSISPTHEPTIDIPPAVWGTPDSSSAGEYNLHQWRGYRRRSFPQHSSSSSEDVRRKLEELRGTPSNCPSRSSPLRNTSEPESPVSPGLPTSNILPVSPISPTSQVPSASPISPVSPKDEEDAHEIGVLPEPSLEFTKVVFLDSYEETPRQTSTHVRNPSAASFDWSEEDEDDDSWVAEAIQDGKSDRRPSQDGIKGHAMKNDQYGGGECSQATLEVPETGRESEEKDFTIADKGNSTFAFEHGMNGYGATMSQINSQKRVFGSQLTVNTSKSGPETGSEDRSGKDPEQFKEDHCCKETPQTYRRAEDIEQISPEFRGPEPLTGLDLEEGFDAWWEWRTRNQRSKFRTNHNPGNKGEQGDLRNYSHANPNTSDAADHLSKQRFMLVELAAREGDAIAAERVSNIGRNMEDTMEYLKLKMLYYRAQRNHFLFETRWSRERVGRREETIKNLEARTERRDERIADLEVKLFEVHQAYKHEKQRYLELEPILKEFQTELQKEKDLREKERSARKELQLKLGNLTQVTDQLRKSAEANAEEVRLARVKQNREMEVDFSDVDEQITQSNGLQIANHNSRSCSAAPSPGPAQFIRWSLAERTQLIPYIIEWINEHREYESREEPLSPDQLDAALGVDAISWDQLVEGLKKIGYTFRPDHLAAALSDSKAIDAGLIPRPNLAVMYAARRLSPKTAVSDLLREVANLHDELEGFRMPQQVQTQIAELESEVRMLQSQQLERRHADMNSIRPIVSEFIQGIKNSAEDKHEPDLHKRISEHQKHEQRLQAEINSLTKQLLESEEACAALVTASAGLEDQIKESRSTSSDDACKIEHLHSDLIAANEATDNLVIDFEKLQAKFDALQEQIQSLSDSNALLEINNATLYEQIKSSHAEFDEIQDEITEFYAQAEAHVFHRENEEIIARNAELDVQAARAEIEGLQDQIDKIYAEFEAHSCSVVGSFRPISITSPTPFPGLMSKGQVDQAIQTDPCLLLNRGAQTWEQREKMLTQTSSFIKDQSEMKFMREQKHAKAREKLALWRNFS